MKKTTKRILRIVIAIMLLFFGILSFWGYHLYRYQFPEISFSPSDNDTLACFRMFGSNIEITLKGERGSLHFSALLDTGDNTACLDLESRVWDWLVERNPGYEQRWQPPIFKIDALGGINSITKQLNQPYYIGKIYTRNKNNQTEYDEINGVHMTQSNDNYSIIGMTLLYDQIVEFAKKDSVLRFLKSVPSDYTEMIKLSTDSQNGVPLRRLSIPIEVNGQTHSYFIDTGIYTPIHLPISDSRYYKPNELKEETIEIQSHRTIQTNIYLWKYGCYVSVGGKQIKTDLNFSDNHKSEYSINPLLLFDENFIIDFKNKQMWFKQ